MGCVYANDTFPTASVHVSPYKMATFSALNVLNDEPPVKPHYGPGNPAILRSFICPMVKNYIHHYYT
jgi:hypothetical protein